ncbi:MAG: hypothetical protein KGK03_04440 [Candidatus Omnitrophica bacterium]|nr:hypothetical protein [Candidatus Omnitrophota bacterium]MDE2222302.1 hypothetical protein [Candidatus Omnitrophota bacterium]
MSKAFLITYDLKYKSTQNYVPFFNAIRTAKWWHYLPDAWIIITDKDATYWQNTLVPLTFQGDFLLIIEVKRQSGGWLPLEAWNWINENIPT